MVMNISCKFEKSTYNTLASRGVTRKSLHAVAAVYSCIIHSIHRMLSGGYNNGTALLYLGTDSQVHGMSNVNVRQDY